MKHSKSAVMISADAKCKIILGEPDFLRAAGRRRKVVIVGKNETFKVDDGDFSTISLNTGRGSQRKW